MPDQNPGLDREQRAKNLLEDLKSGLYTDQQMIAMLEGAFRAVELETEARIISIINSRSYGGLDQKLVRLVQEIHQSKSS